MPKERPPEFGQRKLEVEGTSEHGDHGVREHSDGFMMSPVGKGWGRGNTHYH